MSRSVPRIIERCLWLAGFLALTYCGAFWLNARLQQAEGNRELGRLRSQPVAPLEQGEVVARLEIPRLEMSAIVFEGTDAAVLARGVGHLSGSPLPGSGGNVVLAGHRDTFFRDLRHIHLGDVVRLITARSVASYTVSSTSVVKPNQSEVLASTREPELTLVTCFPFRFLGSAPQRFIVRCRALPAQPSVRVRAARALGVRSDSRPAWIDRSWRSAAANERRTEFSYRSSAP